MNCLVTSKFLVSLGMETFGDLLKKLRDEKNLTQQDLAVAAGVQVSTVSKAERNLHSPEISTLKALAVPLGVDVDVLKNAAKNQKYPGGRNAIMKRGGRETSPAMSPKQRRPQSQEAPQSQDRGKSK